ncbi:flagellar biosynthesis protein FlhA [Vibrio casei]|uniref:Flagellar type III secretion system protein FlhA n=1 Tax=Vibrio casei TaxID=673372 RepID=A0A368LJ33_9VIBR|nr:flagellar biosynthesis protein FlhA [Vibrio casei]RCS70754.1 flagellar type III secretion system protein FlhA [Vibrio casei]SJN25328.1 Flagellar biosynthesis protein FlhA [Vibrio casei]
MSFINSKSAIPIVLLLILAMIILPLPPLLLDTIFTFNIVLAIMILLVCSTTKDVLEFSVFPTLLLVATLLRLTLNVASTRIVLLEGHNGGAAAGKVIQSFGEVVIGGSYVVGIVVFAILSIVNFMVISKGAERVSEVSARFTLDSIQGKQMAIESDMNAGAIDQEEATKRRETLAQQAHFGGAMDGVSKFVKGDIIAGICILFINLIGGCLIGIFEHGMSSKDAFQTYALLTIGDGLVAQIPSLLLATATAIIVTRISDDDKDIAQSIRGQLLSKPSILFMTGGVMFVIGSVPNMPHMAFYLFSGILVFVGWKQSKYIPSEVDEPKTDNKPILKNHLDEPLSWAMIPHVEPIKLHIGFKLVPLVTKSKQTALLKSIRGCRKTLSEQIGFVIPEIMVKDDYSLQPNEYVIYVDGDAIESGRVEPDMLMVVGAEHELNQMDGVIGVDPAYQLPALWIEPEKKGEAIRRDLQIIDVHDVIATHIQKVCIEYLDSIFNFDDVKGVNDRLANAHPELMETLGKVITPSLEMQVLRQLLSEQIPITNIRTIANTLIESIESTKDAVMLASNVRVALKRSIMNLVVPDSRQLNVFDLGPNLTDSLNQSINNSLQNNPNLSLDAVIVSQQDLIVFQNKMPTVVQTMNAQNVQPILLVPPTMRPILSKLTKSFANELVVLSFNEIPNEYSINVFGTIEK